MHVFSFINTFLYIDCLASIGSLSWKDLKACWPILIFFKHWPEVCVLALELLISTTTVPVSTLPVASGNNQTNIENNQQMNTSLDETQDMYSLAGSVSRPNPSKFTTLLSHQSNSSTPNRGAISTTSRLDSSYTNSVYSPMVDGVVGGRISSVDPMTTSTTTSRAGGARKIPTTSIPLTVVNERTPLQPRTNTAHRYI